MLSKTKLLSLTLYLTLTGCSMLPAKQAPQAGQSTSASAMPAQNEDCYVYNNDRYMALAEANLYPSPKKVLDNAQQLQLTDKQASQTQHIYDEMTQFASQLEDKLRSKQQLLDRLFINGTIDDDKLASVLTKISVIETKLRYVHLRAHLQQKAVLTDQQLQQYKMLPADHAH